MEERPHLDVPDLAFDIAENKVQETVSRMESQLFRLNLTTARGEHVDPAKDYMDWLAVCLFRQWLVDNIKAQPGPAICQVYRDLGSDSPSAFLGHKECEAFLALNPQLYTPENLDCLQKRMTDLKARARDLVRPLLHNSLELDVAKFNDPSEILDKPLYFTCTTIDDDEIPWPLEPYVPF
ncbi:hypothetical protein E4U58_007513 [Claviceps cyperi]|nr:hypothetical protein E4U58_007513 [Claviceps cyperi]